MLSILSSLSTCIIYSIVYKDNSKIKSKNSLLSSFYKEANLTYDSLSNFSNFYKSLYFNGRNYNIHIIPYNKITHEILLL